MPGLDVRAGDALLVIDVQKDFLPGGSLPVPYGDAVVVPLNGHIAAFERGGLPIFATRDWHPPDHRSFRARGGPWPPHCVQGTEGAGWAPGLALSAATPTVSTGVAPDREGYSGFEDTDLDDRLRTAGVRRLFVGGLATDYCVLHTVREARARGYEVVVLTDAVRAVDVHPGDGERALEEMARAGAALR